MSATPGPWAQAGQRVNGDRTRQRPPCSRCHEERILTDDDLRALYAQPVTGTHPHAKPAHKPRDWSAE